MPASVGVPAASQFYQVTAYGDVAAHCKIAAVPSASGVQRVACRGSGGRPLDSPFSLSFSWRSSFIGRTDRPFGYGWGRLGKKTTSPGRYTVRLPGVRTDGGGQVVAYAIGGSDAYCHVLRWRGEAADVVAEVGCWSATTHKP